MLQLRESTAQAQAERKQMAEQNQQLLEQVSFVKTNSTATIERLTRNWEQAQAKLKQLEGSGT